jgi:MoxR-like ATPase
MSERFRLVRHSVNPQAHDPHIALARLQARQLPPPLRDFQASAPYFQLDEGLETAINMALAVGAPLLLTGEPGTGKTQVAWYLGWYFGIPVFDYPVKSTSTAEDMKYDFDAVAYLRAAQDSSLEQDKRERQYFLQEKALWRAYNCETVSVLLIDEIDKAPRDFPNDLLQELDKHEFHHPFQEQKIIRPVSGQPPIVVITSNAERRLPDAFLRRCIFHHIELTEKLVRAALAARAGDFPNLDATTREAALQRFFELRANDYLQKRPSTAELLVWLAILSTRGVQAKDLRPPIPLRELLGLTALLKDKEDLERL